MAEYEIVDGLAPAGIGWHDLLDLGAEVVPTRKVEAHRPPAPRAIVAIAQAHSLEPLRLLRPPELPRCDIFGDHRTAHDLVFKGSDLPPG